MPFLSIGSKNFQQNIRAYNNCLSFTSLGAEVNHTVDGPDGVRCFKIQGALYHDMGLMLPRPGSDPAFAQIYVLSNQLENEAAHQKSMSRSKDLEEDIIAKIQEFMYDYNPYARQFKMAEQILQESPTKSISLKLKSIPPTAAGAEGHDLRTYCRPTTEEVAMIVAGGGDVGERDRDLILHSENGTWERVSERHTGYLPLRYPVLFPWGQVGYDEYYRVPTPNSELNNAIVFTRC
ncbi:uncharacterized protein MELLADRAFT_32306 [Melampsora larici-populina 98AG31]|uniref:Uncharacterized protein n=1 Tax=Melampsora larici-populina (strain 98AG31 / pathotype 3-4-7) TaxID=747676 RepID=F4R482_MELLP|nr:uncharacterized protein MELLADRAFT_32306 [Melampsora larici-populina 98AG31]EGG12760.1 hypothetical protein MELLADRAFT_32306 [Melampsora larici-populina 98AG31]